MKIKLTPAYVLSFFVLAFLIHEIHDWIHVFVAKGVTGCWGSKAFDLWNICTKKGPISPRDNFMITIAGPLFNWLVICWGWELMSPENEIHQKSLGFSLVFASLPFPRILAAFVGGGDETNSLRMLFQRGDGHNHYYVAGAGLLIVLVLSIPAIYRALMLAPGWAGKLFVVGFLVIPGYIDRWVVGGLLNKMLAHGILDHLVWTGYPLAVLVWPAFLILVLLFAGRNLLELFEYREVSL